MQFQSAHDRERRLIREFRRYDVPFTIIAEALEISQSRTVQLWREEIA